MTTYETRRRYQRRFEAWKIEISMRCAAIGCFDDGWSWKVGFQAGGRTAIFSLLIVELRVDWGLRNAQLAAAKKILSAARSTP